MRVWRTSAVVIAAGLGLVAGCGGSDGAVDSRDSVPAPTTVTSVAPPVTTPAPSTSTVPASTSPTTAWGTTTVAPPVNTLPALIPGQPCTAGSDPDCIDPEGTGQFVYLIGGAHCMASPIRGPLCSDLDGDGQAGYPDSG